MQMSDNLVVKFELSTSSSRVRVLEFGLLSSSCRVRVVEFDISPTLANANRWLILVTSHVTILTRVRAKKCGCLLFVGTRWLLSPLQRLCWGGRAGTGAWERDYEALHSLPGPRPQQNLCGRERERERGEGERERERERRLCFALLVILIPRPTQISPEICTTLF